MTKSNLPTWEVYGNYSSDNYGAHALRFWDADDNCFWFSYKTLVAFMKCGPNGTRRIVHENDWGPTTGKHLNAIDGGNKKERVDDATFQRLFEECFGRKLEAA